MGLKYPCSIYPADLQVVAPVGAIGQEYVLRVVAWIRSPLRERQDAVQSIRRDFQPQIEAELDLLEKQVSTVDRNGVQTSARRPADGNRAEIGRAHV